MLSKTNPSPRGGHREQLGRSGLGIEAAGPCLGVVCVEKAGCFWLSCCFPRGFPWGGFGGREGQGQSLGSPGHHQAWVRGHRESQGTGQADLSPAAQAAWGPRPPDDRGPGGDTVGGDGGPEPRGCARWGLRKSLGTECIAEGRPPPRAGFREELAGSVHFTPLAGELSPFAGSYQKPTDTIHEFCRFGENLGGSQGALKLHRIPLPLSTLLFLLPSPLPFLFPLGSCALLF